MMQIDNFGRAFIKHFEAPDGPSLTAYPDSTGHSIGYGHLIQSGEGDLFKGITKSQADQLFEKDVQKAVNLVNSRVNAKLTQNQFNACVSLAYNCPNAFVGGSIEDKINAKVDRSVLEPTWELYVYSKDPTTGKPKVLPALVDRRNAEMNLYYEKQILTDIKHALPLILGVLLIAFLIVYI